MKCKILRLSSLLSRWVEEKRAPSNGFCWLSTEKHKGKQMEVGDPEPINKKISQKTPCKKVHLTAWVKESYQRTGISAFQEQSLNINHTDCNLTWEKFDHNDTAQWRRKQQEEINPLT